MKLVMTLLGGGNAEVVDAQLAFHLHAGVDVVVAEGSAVADVAGVLDDYGRAGHICPSPQPTVGLSISDRVTRMARLAAGELGADWVINCGRTEFWWPRGGSLREVIGAVPARYGIVRALPRAFVEPPEATLFAERLTIRRSTKALVAAGGGTTPASLGALHRADPDVVIGSDGLPVESDLVLLRGWYPIEVLRFPSKGAGDLQRDDDAIERGLENGSLVVDTRLRDFLQVLWLPEGAPRTGAGRFVLPSEGPAVGFPRSSVVDDAAYAVEVAAFGEVDEVVMRQRLDAAERKIAALELSVWTRLRWKLRRRARRA